MTGSNSVLIVVPIVMMAALAFWLGLVYFVGAHPEWKAHRLAREAEARQAAAIAGDQARGVPGGEHAAGVPAGEQGARAPAGSRPAGAPGGGQTRITPRAT